MRCPMPNDWKELDTAQTRCELTSESSQEKFNVQSSKVWSRKSFMVNRSVGTAEH